MGLDPKAYERFQYPNGERFSIMMCFKDMTFCHSNCIRSDCKRHWTQDKADEAEKWWGSPNPPVAFSDFSPTCGDYRTARATYIGKDEALAGKTALAMGTDKPGIIKVQVDQKDHPWSHGWHETPAVEWRNAGDQD